MPDANHANEAVAALLARESRAARMLLNRGMHWVGCAVAPFETLAEVCLIYGVLDRMLEDLGANCQCHVRTTDECNDEYFDR